MHEMLEGISRLHREHFKHELEILEDSPLLLTPLSKVTSHA